MTLKKRILSAAIAGCMVLSSVATTVTGYAAKTILSDGDTVYDFYPEYFCINGELDEGFIKALEKATKCDYEEITFAHLYKITSFDLSDLKLEGVPKVVEYMQRLRTLKLNDNNLRIITAEEMEAYREENGEIDSMGAVNNLDLSDCINLSSVDISDNYLTSVPAWFASLDITGKKIYDNMINTTGQRSIEISGDTYYFMLGDNFNENEFKDKLLSTLKLSDNSVLPEYFFDPELPTYDFTEEDEEDEDFARNERVEVELDTGKCVKDNVVASTGTINGVVRLVGTSEDNKNTNFKFKVHFLDGNDPSTVRIRLETLVQECEDIKKEEFTGTTWKAFEASLDTAKALLDYSGADSAMLRSALENLSADKNALVAGINSATKKTLTELVSISKTFDEDDYTEESWKKFQAAVTLMSDLASDPDASIADANDAIRDYQYAQANLTATKLERPSVILKSEFEEIYGEDKTVIRRGTTRGGEKYTVTFTGKDIETPADFDAEIVYSSDYEEKIRLEVGSASDYHLFSFAKEGMFPGKAEVTMDVSETYKDGTYRLYKWNKSTSKSEFVKEVEIVDGSVTIDFTEGGNYFISSVLQNFAMISANFDIDHEKLTISSKFKSKYTVADFRASLDNGEAVTVLNADGTATLDDDRISTGMTAAAANSDVAYSIIVPGDIDGDGIVTALDAVMILRAIIGEITLDSYAVKAAADITGDGWVRVDDSVEILRYCIGA